jgi:hypothetical protein
MYGAFGKFVYQREELRYLAISDDRNLDDTVKMTGTFTQPSVWTGPGP